MQVIPYLSISDKRAFSFGKHDVISSVPLEVANKDFHQNGFVRVLSIHFPPSDALALDFIQDLTHFFGHPEVFCPKLPCCI